MLKLQERFANNYQNYEALSWSISWGFRFTRFLAGLAGLRLADLGPGPPRLHDRGPWLRSGAIYGPGPYKIPNKNIGALRLFKNPFKGLVNALVGWMHSFSIGSSSPGPPSVQIPSRPETDQFSNTIPTPSGNRRYWRSLRRKILPTAFLGSASMNSTTRGTLKVARCCLQWSMIA